ncbi:hypothetical protein Bca52824_048688 [Brassica carinata]|uniref:Endonuclease/exonuclease/phosphatase domain-containing protein n=1 Tax=Brassica carinata TaxID=52824 RepID=A0A8X7RH61_BRACI|nr:hypothetical protein Bca52824_048688 [Brassica carinata]
MDIFCWNIRGFNCKIKRRGFRKWLKANQPIFGGLLETHVSHVKTSRIIQGVFPGWHFECNYEFSDLGKIWLLWHPSVKVSVFHKSLQSISCFFNLPFVSTQLAVTMVYGSNCRKVRKQLWADLNFLTTSPSVSGSPWSVLGDFNQILIAHEHSTGDQFTSTRGMREFMQCTHNTQLQDLIFYGNSFTWTNNQGDGVISKKLDRILVNDNCHAFLMWVAHLDGLPTRSRIASWGFRSNRIAAS